MDQNNPNKKSGNAWMKYTLTFLAGGAVVAIAFYSISGQYLTGSVYKVDSKIHKAVEATDVKTISEAAKMDKSKEMIELPVAEELTIPETVKDIAAPCKDGCRLEDMIVDLKADVVKLQSKIDKIESDFDKLDLGLEERMTAVADSFSNESWARMNVIDHKISDLEEWATGVTRELRARIQAINGCTNSNACVNGSWEQYLITDEVPPFSSIPAE